MKTSLFAAILAVTLSVPAIAQDTTQPPAGGSMPAAGDATMQPPPATPDSTMPAAPDATAPAAGATPPTADPAMPAPAADPAMPAPAAAPMSSSMPMASAPAAGDPSTYPTCSRTVKDRCVNPSAKGMKHKRK